MAVAVVNCGDYTDVCEYPSIPNYQIQVRDT